MREIAKTIGGVAFYFEIRSIAPSCGIGSTRTNAKVSAGFLNRCYSYLDD